VQVRYVHDGDSLVLRDERKIRLIGINSPEMARKGQPDQALAIKARDRLRQLLFKQGNRARLVYGKQRKDRHGRALAHLWSADGTNLSAALLGEGLGWALAIPPNIQWLDCYLAAENKARSVGRGVWGQPVYAAKKSTQLDLRESGFHRVRGRIVRVNRGGGALWINLQGRFAVRIAERDLQWFATPPDGDWIGREIEVRGWLYTARGEVRVNLHHPAALQQIGAP
jgi:endonuclease YncB( thermonuclease family)